MGLLEIKENKKEKRIQSKAITKSERVKERDAKKRIFYYENEENFHLMVLHTFAVLSFLLLSLLILFLCFAAVVVVVSRINNVWVCKGIHVYVGTPSKNASECGCIDCSILV